MPIPPRMKKPRAPRQAAPLSPPASRHPAKGGILLKLSSDLETVAGDKGARWVGQISSLCSQRFLGADLGEAEAGGGSPSRLPTPVQAAFARC